MNKIAILLISSAMAVMADINISDLQMKKLGITVGKVSVVSTTKIGPFIAKIDYDEERSKSYFLNHEASVLSLNVRAGERVKKGKILGRILSPELMNINFELKELRNRYNVIHNNAKKDEVLYKDGVISYRDYQNSTLEVASLKSRIASLESRFSVAGVRATADGTLAVIAQKSGIITDAPLAIAEKIVPYEPYFRISDPDAMIAILNISPKQINTVSKGDKVLNEGGNIMGTIVSVSPSVNLSNNSATAIARLHNVSGELRAGTTNALFLSAVKPISSIQIPSSAVVKHQGKSVCFIRTPSGFRAQQLNVSGTSKEGVLVSQKGIDSTTNVAISGLVALKGSLSGLGFE